MMGLTRGEYDSEERKRSKEEKVFLMTNLRDLIIQEGMAKALSKSLTHASTAGNASEQADEGEYERT